jgi:hypothetical protein
METFRGLLKKARQRPASDEHGLKRNALSASIGVHQRLDAVVRVFFNKLSGRRSVYLPTTPATGLLAVAYSFIGMRPAS